MGLLAVYVFGTEREFTDDELTLLRAMADHSAQAIANARLFEEVRLKSSQLQALSAQLAAAQEAERQRIARDLHDQVGSTLTALGLNLGILRSQSSTKALARLGGTIDDSRKLLEEATEQFRSIMADLRPPVLDDYGLLAALRWYTERFEPGRNWRSRSMATEPSPTPVAAGRDRVLPHRPGSTDERCQACPCTKGGDRVGASARKPSA